MEDLDSEVICYNFNHDQDLLLIGTTNGFGIFDLNSLTLVAKYLTGGISLCEMIGSSNYVLIVGAGEDPDFSQKTFKLWDTKRNKCTCECFYDAESILNIKANLQLFAVMTSENLYIYGFPKISIIKQIKLDAGPRLMEISYNTDLNFFLYADEKIKNEEKESRILSSYIPDLLKKENCLNQIWSDSTSLSDIKLNKDGTWLAIACEKGTKIHILRVAQSALLLTFYRGKESATIYSLNFSANSDFLICTSSRKTVHIFDTRPLNSKSQDSARISEGFNLSGKIYSAVNSVKSALKLDDGKNEEHRSIKSFNYESDSKLGAIFFRSSNIIFLIDQQGYLTKYIYQDSKGHFEREFRSRIDENLKFEMPE